MRKFTQNVKKVVLKEKNCKECGTVMTGRADKIFCGDMCRNEYHNRNKSQENEQLRGIVNIIRRNRKILQGFYEKNIMSVTIEQLHMQGFNFKFYTHQEKVDEDNCVIYCFDHGYQLCETYCLLARRAPVASRLLAV
jgi:ribosomal protein S27AE